MNNSDFTRRLSALIGRDCVIDGEKWSVLDVLSDEATLVLQRQDAAEAPIQEDAFGSPLRRAPATRTVAVFSDEGELNEEARELLLALQAP